MNVKVPRVWVAMQVEADFDCEVLPGDVRQFREWELIGVFTTEENAVAACKEPTDCVAPVELDAVAPREREIFPGAYYPLARKELP